MKKYWSISYCIWYSYIIFCGYLQLTKNVNHLFLCVFPVWKCLIMFLLCDFYFSPGYLSYPSIHYYSLLLMLHSTFKTVVCLIRWICFIQYILWFNSARRTALNTWASSYLYCDFSKPPTLSDPPPLFVPKCILNH